MPVDKARKPESTRSTFEEPRCKKAYSKQLRLETVSIRDVELKFQCRDRLVPVLRALQRVDSNSELTDRILKLIGVDIDADSRTHTGRNGMDYW